MFQSDGSFLFCSSIVLFPNSRVAYGSAAHLLNLFVYLLGLLPLTHLIVSLRPSLDYTGPDNTTAVTMVPISFREVLYTNTGYMAVKCQVLWARL